MFFAILGFFMALALGCYLTVAGLFTIRLCLGFKGSLANSDGVYAVCVTLLGIVIVYFAIVQAPIRITLNTISAAETSSPNRT